jgi:hypothetical protein
LFAIHSQRGGRPGTGREQNRLRLYG